MRLAHEGVAQHGFTVFAHEQTAGKGQRAKQWIAEPGANIMMSVVLTPEAIGVAGPSFLFSMAMAVAAHGLLKKFCDGIKIKWPNDLFIGDRKAGGILIENRLQGHNWQTAVAGFGLNINQTAFGNLSSKATSLKLITGETYSPVALAKDLCSEIHGVLKKLKTEPQDIANEYHRHLYKIGEWVKLKQDSRIFETEIKGVNQMGELLTQQTLEERFAVGDVEWLL